MSLKQTKKGEKRRFSSSPSPPESLRRTTVVSSYVQKSSAPTSTFSSPSSRSSDLLASRRLPAVVTKIRFLRGAVLLEQSGKDGEVVEKAEVGATLAFAGGDGEEDGALL
jgi:hypothetical protein